MKKHPLTVALTRRWFTLALALLLCSSVLTACATATQDSTDLPTTALNDEDTTEPEDIYADLPNERYDGYKFRLPQYKETTNATSTVLVTESSEAPIEQAVFERTIAVEEKLGVEFVNVVDGLEEVISMLSKSIQANLNEFDVFFGHSSRTVSSFLTKGQLQKLSGIANLDFDKPWWDKTANDYLRIGDDVYMAFGDINLYLFDFHSTLVFNKTITENYQLDPYTMVEDGTWTMEAFCQAVTDTALESSTGQGYDRHGFTGYGYATMFGFLHGADVNLFGRDEMNYPTFTQLDENYRTTLVRYSQLFRDNGLCRTDDMSYRDDFINQKATFLSCAVGELGTLRSIENFEYGLLPFPKRTAEQESYISFVSNQIQPMVIPLTAKNTERIGAVLEHLAAESYRRVRGEYFDVLLKYKYVRDPESMEILQNIFDSETRFEMEQIYNWAAFDTQVMTALTSRASEQFTSTVASKRGAVNRAIGQTLRYLGLSEEP